MHRGYVKIYRKLWDSVYWKSKPFDKGRAWVDLIMLANWEPGELDVRGIIVTVERGQVGWSKKQLANTWGWSEGKVTLFLKQLENRAQIVVQKNNVTSIITIKNYEKYHGEEAQNGEETEHRPRAVCAQAAPKKKLEEVKEGEEVTAAALKDGEDWPLITMSELAHLRSVPGYPFDLKMDFAKLGELSLEFPMVDVVPLLKNWKLYIGDNPFAKKSSPRAQLRNQFVMAKNKGKYKKAEDNGSGPPKPDALERMKAAQKQEGQPL